MNVISLHAIGHAASIFLVVGCFVVFWGIHRNL